MTWTWNNHGQRTSTSRPSRCWPTLWHAAKVWPHTLATHGYASHAALARLGVGTISTRNDMKWHEMTVGSLRNMAVLKSECRKEVKRELPSQWRQSKSWNFTDLLPWNFTHLRSAQRTPSVPATGSSWSHTWIIVAGKKRCNLPMENDSLILIVLKSPLNTSTYKYCSLWSWCILILYLRSLLNRKPLRQLARFSGPVQPRRKKLFEVYGAANLEAIFHQEFLVCGIMCFEACLDIMDNHGFCIENRWK